MDKLISFSEHAKERMSFRKIGRVNVIKVVNEPTQRMPDEDNNNREIYQSLMNDDKGKMKLLRVVIEETSTEL
ncbi:MAG: hypothetical protein HW421_4080 [Ignavibacteria bacterium]|nr:hypothetical protein [Ignavibacteria bacterium]